MNLRNNFIFNTVKKLGDSIGTTDYAVTNNYLSNYAGIVLDREQYNALGPEFHSSVVNTVTDNPGKFSPYFPRHGEKFEVAQEHVFKALDHFQVPYDRDAAPKADGFTL